MTLSVMAKAALCVCPPALMAGTVATVPSVKRAVHQVTRDRAAPRPAVRRDATPARATRAAGVPCPTVYLGPPGQAIPGVPLVTYAVPVPDEPIIGLPDAPGGVGPSGPGYIPVPSIIPPFGGGGGFLPEVPIDPGTPIPPTQPPVTDPPPVPEPATWLLMIVGVGTLGGVLRKRRREQAVSNTAARPRTLLGRMRFATAAGPLGVSDLVTGVAAKATVGGIAAKTLLCVCPAAVVATAVVAVPPVRQAVHAATYPSAPAVRTPVEPPCDPSLTPVVTTPATASAAPSAPAASAPAPAAAG